MFHDRALVDGANLPGSRRSRTLPVPVAERLRARAELLLDWASATAPRSIALLVLLAFLAFLPGIAAIPPTDRDESRFAQATRQMIETGDYINIRLQDEARNKKPVGIYWLQAAVVAATGQGVDAPIWAYRVPSVLGAVGGVVLTWWALLPLAGRRGALLAGMLLAATVLLGVEARIAKTDAVLLALTTLAMGCLVRAFLDPGHYRRTAIPWLFWGAVGASTMVKGPVTLMVAALAAAALSLYDRSPRWLGALRSGWGVPLALLITAPWFVAIALESGGAFFRDSLGGDMLSKVNQAGEAHWGPPGYQSALFWIVGWPAAPFFALALPWIWRNRRRREVVILLAWAVPTWVVFEAVSTKLPHYVLPAYPAIAGLTALAIGDGIETARRGWRALLASGLWLLPLGLLVAAAGLLFWFEGSFSLGLAAFGAAAVAGGVLAALVAQRSLAAAVPVAAAATVLLSVAVQHFALPSLQTFWLSQRMADAVARTAVCERPRLATAAYHEPSLVFLTRTDLVLANGTMAADFLAAPGCRMAFVDAEPTRAGGEPEEAAFRRRVAELRLPVTSVATVEGRSVNGGHRRRMVLWRTGG